MSKSLAFAKNRRTVWISQIERSAEFEHRVQPDVSITSIEELQIRIDALNEAFSNFKADQLKIEELDPEEYKNDERAKYEEIYFKTLATLKTLQQTLKPPQEAKGESSSTIRFDPLRLPVIELPTFSGDTTKWISWFQTFSSLIDTNPHLSTLAKFHHLMAKLSPLARAPIAELKVEAENYPQALKMLKERFENKKVIAQEHLSRIFSYPKLQRSSAADIRALMDTFNNQLSCLRNLSRPVDQWDDLIVTIILVKLDSTTLMSWNDKAPVDRLPALSELFDFLKKRCLKIEGNCPSTFNCRECGDKHHSLLHNNQYLAACTTFTQGNSNNTTPLPTLNQAGHSRAVDNTSSFPSSVLQVSAPGHQHKYTLLATAVVYVLNKNKIPVPCRVLLDSGAQINLITERFAQTLGLTRKPSTCSLAGISNSNTLSTSKISFLIKSQFNDFSSMIDANVISAITGLLPHDQIDTSNWIIPKNLKLSDPLFNTPQKIDILLGAELFFSILCVGQIKLSESLPTLQNTLLGWVVSGAFYSQSKLSVAINSVNTVCNACSENLNETLKLFWHIENHEINNSTILSKEEQLCESHFIRNFSRLPSGRYQVRLPFKEKTNLLGKSYDAALRRFQSLERKLHKNSELYDSYSSFIEEYIALGHMEAVANFQINKSHYFLPHHCVLKPSSSTTKLRVVFDASAKTSSGFSLNDLLMVGPVVQPDLFAIILKFRIHNFVFSADISKMYRQVVVSEEDRNFQCILWRHKGQNEVQIYRLSTVTYGTSPASFLATRALKQLSIDEGVDFPLAAKEISSSFYVDDVLTGAKTLDEAKRIQHELTSLLSRGGFELRKWCANNTELLNNIPMEHRESLYRVKNSDAIKTLGMAWIPESDKFTFEVLPVLTQGVTKRTVLSELSKLFDPLGLINPIIVVGKLFMQQLWELRLPWDQSLPLQLHTLWIQYRAELQELNNITMLRQVFFGNQADYQLHAFSDSSERAYGACIYIRSVKDDGLIHVGLLCSKSKVAKRGVSLPRLELCAAVLMSQLVKRVRLALGFEIKTFYWTDSSIVLSWLSEEPSSWQTFFANRVAAIQETSIRGQWFHVPTKSNPADIVSRGAYPKALMTSNLWFHGPSFLRLDFENWPNDVQTFQCSKTDLELERRKELKVFSAFQRDNILTDIKFHHNYDSLIRVVGYMLRFLFNCRAKKTNQRNLCGRYLGVKELEDARNKIVRIVQMEVFQPELEDLKRGKEICARSHLRSLCPFIDADGMIRVGGRLQNALVDFNTAHPILLPKRHFFTEAVFKHFHEKYHHAGPQTLLSMVRQIFWPVHGRAISGRVFRNCITCFKTRPLSCQQLMGDLPPSRVQQNRPFNIVGIDFCGPFFVHFRRRGTTPVKAYISVFVCFVTKAIHLELVEDLTSSAFIAALRRFVGRRGLCSVIYSDNATNFIGAKNELQELREMFQREESREEILRELSADGITWKNIPARSPHFGGLWEAAVKSAKFHLKRILQQTSLTFFELNTIIIQVEAILNSRPLCPLLNNPNNFPALTPGHFIIGTPLAAIVGPNLKDVKNFNRLDRWQQLQWHVQHFWDRWSKEYLQSLQQRTKWSKMGQQLHLDDIVLIQDDNLPPMKWSLGRVIELHPGKDGICRVVTLKTSSGKLQRAANKVRRLPLDVEEPSILQGGENV